MDPNPPRQFAVLACDELSLEHLDHRMYEGGRLQRGGLAGLADIAPRQGALGYDPDQRALLVDDRDQVQAGLDHEVARLAKGRIAIRDGECALHHVGDAQHDVG